MKLVQDVWVIMDKNKKAIACGVPRNREMRMFKDCNKRILTYQTEAKARAGYKVSGFYDRTKVDNPQEGIPQSYLGKEYGKLEVRDGSYKYYKKPPEEEYLIPVKAKIVIEI